MYILRGKPKCADCCAELEPWEEVYTWDEGRRVAYLCCDCFDGRFEELDRHERAELIGSEYMPAYEMGREARIVNIDDYRRGSGSGE